MKSLILMLSCLMMSGCLYQTVNRYDLDEAEIICANQQSHVIHIEIWFGTSEFVMCADNSRTKLHKEKINGSN